MKFFVLFSPSSCHFLPLRTKYSPQHPVPKTFSVYCGRSLITEWILL